MPRVGLVAAGGGGAMVCAVGVARALEEAGLEIGGISTAQARQWPSLHFQQGSTQSRPLPYEEIRGIRLYEQFIDRRPSLDFMRRGHAAARRELEALQRAPAPER